MKKSLLFLVGVFSSAMLFAQGELPVVVEHHNQIDEYNNGNSNGNIANKKGDRVEYDSYYERRSGMQVDSLLLDIGQYRVVLKPTSTNYLFWKEMGNWYPFWGQARVLGGRIAYRNRKQNEGADNYDLNLYHATGPELKEPDEILASRSFAGYEISTGTDLDSFTYIEFKSSDFTQITNGFMMSVALEDITAFADSLDEVSIYSSLEGDGFGEHRAMVKLSNESILWTGDEYVPLDRCFSDGQGSYYEFDYDIMIIPVLDVEAGIGFIDMKGAKFNGHFPSPAQNQFTIDLDIEDPQNNMKISVQTIGGKTLKTINTGFLSQGKQLINVDISDLASGSYIYTVNSDNSAFSSMIVITD
ncbi:MAG: T9SS type A sorting domain-containing protein [Bacteroidia bacterium]